MRFGASLIAAMLALPLLGAAAALCPEDLAIRLDRTDKMAELSRLYPADALRKVARFYLEDPAGRRIYRRWCQETAELVNRGDFTPRNGEEYIYAVNLIRPGFIYLFSGNPELGRFIRERTMAVVARPLGFWLHEERFPHDAEKGIATLRTGQLLYSLLGGVDLARDAFTASELEAVNRAVKAKGIEPSRRYYRERCLKPGKFNNWLVNIATGMMYAAKFTGDRAAFDEAVGYLERWIEHSVEDDGSYYEGPGYLLYPVSNFTRAAVLLTPAERDELFNRGPIRKIGTYALYSMVFNGGKDDLYIRPHFRDNAQFRAHANDSLAALMLICRDPVLAGYFRKFGRGAVVFNPLLNLLRAEADNDIVPVSLDQLPRLRCFSNGEVYLRENFDNGGLVFALLSGGPGKPGFGHDRPVRNGIVIAAYGEYLLVNPGHSSYRGRTCREWDHTTRGSNCITIDGRSQLYPVRQGPFSEIGTPVARVAAARMGDKVDFLASEAAKCYKPAVETALRAVVYVRDPGYYVVFDRIETPEPHRFDSYFHFSNLFNQGRFLQLDSNNFLHSRPGASLRTYFAAREPTGVRINPGILHHVYEYRPDGPRTGKPGSSFELQLSPVDKSRKWNVVTAFFPQKAGRDAPFKCRGDGVSLQVELAGRTDRFDLTGRRLTANIGGAAEYVDLNLP